MFAAQCQDLTRGWDIATSIATVAAVLVSICILYLQRRDLHLERSRQRQQQANALMVDTRHDHAPSDAEGYAPLRHYLSLTNASDRPIRVEHVELRLPLDKTDEQWSPWGMKSISIDNDGTFPLILQHGQRVEWPQPDGHYVESNIGGAGFALVRFRDSDNRIWERRTDTYALRSPFDQNSGQLEILWRKPSHALLFNLGALPYFTIFWICLRAVRKQPDTVPIALQAYTLIERLGFEATRRDAWDSSWDDKEIYLHPILYCPNPLRIPGGESEYQSWQHQFEEGDPATWAHGAIRMKDLVRAIWRHWQHLGPNGPLGLWSRFFKSSEQLEPD